VTCARKIAREYRVFKRTRCRAVGTTQQSSIPHNPELSMSDHIKIHHGQANRLPPGVHVRVQAHCRPVLHRERRRRHDGAILPGPCGSQVPHNQRHDPALDQALALDPQDGHDTAWRSISPHTIRSGFWKCGLTPRPENEDAASKMDEETGVLDLLSSLEIAPTDLPVVLPSNEIDRDDDMELVILCRG